MNQLEHAIRTLRDLETSPITATTRERIIRVRETIYELRKEKQE